MVFRRAELSKQSHNDMNVRAGYAALHLNGMKPAMRLVHRFAMPRAHPVADTRIRAEYDLSDWCVRECSEPPTQIRRRKIGGGCSLVGILTAHTEPANHTEVLAVLEVPLRSKIEIGIKSL
jgi:hypothetical protein